MAWHNRYINSTIQSVAFGSGVRLTVEFRRQDLLWVSPTPLLNPKTGETLNLPIHLSKTLAVGPNILDTLERETIKLREEVETIATDGSKLVVTKDVEKKVWRLRSPLEFFPLQKEEGTSEHPLRKRYCTGGTVLSDEGDFIRISKRSSVSINALVYRLAIGMTGSAVAASHYIGSVAATAWERDLVRVLDLYNLITQAEDSFVADAHVPAALKPTSSVGQTVENAVLRDACAWLGIDPDTPLQRRRGRPRSRTQDEDGNATSSGQVIELTLQPDGSVSGRLISSFLGLPKTTVLAALTLSKLAKILVALREAELMVDADLLEAYLEAVNPDWRDTIAEELGVEDSNNSSNNPWVVLGLTPKASLEQVKKAYRKIMRQVHPDTSGLPQWYAQTVNDAYRQLLEELKNDQTEEEFTS